MKKISRISGALLISMLLSSVLSGVVLVIMETLNLPLDMQSIKVICGSIASVGYFYFFRIFTKEIEKININEISLNKKFSVWDGIGYLLVLLGGTTILSGITDIILEFIKRYLVHTENVGAVGRITSIWQGYSNFNKQYAFWYVTCKSATVFIYHFYGNSVCEYCTYYR